MLHLHLFQFLLQHLDVIVALDKLCPLIHVLVLPFDIRPDGIDTKLNSEVCDSKVDKTRVKYWRGMAKVVLSSIKLIFKARLLTLCQLAAPHVRLAEASCHQVWPLIHFFDLLFVKKIIDLPLLGLGPLKDFLSWHSKPLGPKPRLLRCFHTEKQGHFQEWRRPANKN